MNQKIIINTPLPGEDGTTDWFETNLIAQGVEKDGYTLNSSFTQMKASGLPEEYMPALMGVVQHLISDGEADGGKRCEAASARIVSIPPVIHEEEDGVIVETEEARERVELAVHWQWSDGRMDKPETMMLDDEGIAELVKYLLTSEAYA